MIKYPGGTIAFWSVVYILVATPLAYSKFADGKFGLGFLVATLPIGCALIWFRVRPVKWLVATYLGLAALRAIALLFTDGLDLEPALGAALGAYTAFQFAVWDGGPSSGSPVA
ncbi:hypothetical protein CA13_31700 [Planctomycetes bacterium CA13]|uniref:Uncharacterized protein n=1 Tax=Novipirellula herctigrandis TaxID=2527986 RepID=A0A5C5Z407_9BACT|nr:hypothetical protein CA13_31700 [Planctomycetes bacterium CA13]